jgi:glutaredoxin
MTRTTVVVYSREDCCLCDDALREVEAARASIPFDLRVVDVDQDPALAERYGHEVPVIEIDGRKAFKYRVTSRELLRRLERAV